MNAGTAEDQSISNRGASAPESSSRTQGRLQQEVRLRCPCCHTMTMYRQERFGWLEEIFLPLFGIYPWACRDCREPVYFRNRGRSSSVKD